MLRLAIYCMLLRLSCVLCCVLVGSSTLVGQEINNPPSHQSGGPYLQAILTNADCLRSYDVLIRSDSFDDIGPREYIKHRSTIRIRFDWDKERFLVVHRGERRSLEKGADSETVKQFHIGRQYDHEHFAYTQFDSPPYSSVKLFSEAVLLLEETPDVRYIGFRPYSTPFSRHFDFKGTLAAVTKFADCTAQEINGDRIEVIRRSKFLKSDDIMTNTWIIDARQLIPLTLSQSLRRIEEGEPQIYKMATERFAWIERNGVFLPERVESLRPGMTNDDRQIQFEAETTVQFHWFSVNQPVDVESVSVDHIADVSEAVKLLDIKLSGAHSIKE